MKAARRLLTVILVLATVCCCGCDAVIEKIIEHIDENTQYEYDVRVGFADESDRERLEARLEALDVEIIGVDDGIYTLRAHRRLTDGFFKAVCADEPSVIANELGSEIITQEDVTAAEFDGVVLELTVDKELAESISEELEDLMYAVYGEDKDAVLTAIEEKEGGYLLSFCLSDEDAEYGDGEASVFEKASVAFVNSKASEHFRSQITADIVEMRNADV